jgi:hypothetical protein
MLLFGMMSYMPRAGQHERMEGTVRISLEFVIYTMIISVIFCLLGFLMQGFMPMMYVSPQMGIWPLVMCEMVVDCNRDPEVARNLCCLPINIKSKYFPWIFLAIFVLMAPDASLSLVVGFMVGHMQIKGLLDRFRPSEVTARKWEARWPFSKYKSHEAFV